MEAFQFDAATEPVFCLSPHDFAFSEIHGTRSHLEAEGLIPKGTQWPAGYDDLRWTSGQFEFWLRRQRPVGAKGPRKLYIDVDYWFLRWELKDGADREREIAIKAARLRKQLFDLSPQGQRARAVLFSASWKAHSDAGFQRFMAAAAPVTRRSRSCGR